MKDEIETNEQIKILDKITDKALKQLELESKNKPRNYIFEWLFHKAVQKENGISLYYDFVPVLLNNKYLGIYALEESFDKTMLEKNNRQNSPIIKLDMSLVRNSLQINDGNIYKLDAMSGALLKTTNLISSGMTRTGGIAITQ